MARLTMNRDYILDTAKDLINNDRAEDYGDAKENFADIADAWTLYTGHSLVAHDVAIMMALLKIMRIKNGKPKIDNAIDCVGYIALAGEILTYD